jgi:AraC family transcriptional regulator, regulatory protein of adaptative response / methylated-DNA-[protein]-cysteine methyltransferase
MINTNQQLMIDEEANWQAVLKRDAAFDGKIYYGVRSTGVYCKPSCPSRRPGRAQVIFFASPADAEQAGFRACRRCRPDELFAGSARAELAERAIRLIESQVEDPLPLDELGRQLGVNPYHLHRVFKEVTGLTPRQYAAARRMEQFKSNVKEGEQVTSAMYGAGYSSNSRLYETATSRLGMTPASYRRGGTGMDIRYTIVECYLGRLLVAATQRGVCAVSFADEDQALVDFVKSEYPAARLQRDDTFLKEQVSTLLDYLSGAHPALQLPLDLQATAFQLRVWEELRRIPYGETRTYSQVAESIGNPKAVRAVANACANNPAALVTPCHRVVRSDGTLGGYRYGEARKQALLAREQKKLH